MSFERRRGQYKRDFNDYIHIHRLAVARRRIELPLCQSFFRAAVEAFIGTANLGVTSFDGGEVTLEELFFVKAGSVVTGSYTYDEPRDDADPRLIKLGDVPAIVYSETIADLRYVTREPEAQDG